MSQKVESLQRASLKDPVKVHISKSKYQTVYVSSSFSLRLHALPALQLLGHVDSRKLQLIPGRQSNPLTRDTYSCLKSTRTRTLVYLVNEFAGQSIIVFSGTVRDTQRLAILLRTLGFGALALHGRLTQTARLGALNKFKSGSRDILVATDVAARGLDIPKVDVVINYDMPLILRRTSTEWAGRQERGSRPGFQHCHTVSAPFNDLSPTDAYTSRYHLESYLRIEHALGKKLAEHTVEKDEVMVFQARVDEAQRDTRNEMRALDERDRKRKGRRLEKGSKRPGKRADDMDVEEA